MKLMIISFLLGIHAAHAVIHSWKAFLTGSTGLSEFPEFVAVNILDDEVMGYFDSKTNRFEAKQSWMEQNLGQQYVEQETNVLRGSGQTFKASVGIVMERFNQSTGVHTFQLMYGCELDDDGTTRGYFQYGYDGADFLSLDQSTLTWTAANQKAVITKLRWDATGINANYQNNYLENGCIEWLKKYVDYGKDTLGRKVHPSVSLFQKSPSSPVTCHATGFYPRGVMVFWRRDGEDVFEDVDLGETLPNQDGTFQARSTLSVSAEELETHDYTCVVQHSSDMHRDIILNVADLKKNDSGSGLSAGLIAGIVIGVVVLLALVGVGVGLLVRKNRTRKPDDHSFSRANTDDDSNASSDAAIKT